MTGEEDILAKLKCRFSLVKVMLQIGKCCISISAQIALSYHCLSLMDLLNSMDTKDGADCLTTSEKMSQRQAAEEAVSKIGLPMTAEIDPEWFAEESIREMFFKRLEVLQTLIDKYTD